MEYEFKIGELVKVTGPGYTCPRADDDAKRMGLFNWVEGKGQWDGSVREGDAAIVVGLDGLNVGIRMGVTGESFVIGRLGLESIDNPPKPAKELTHLIVFRAIHAGILPNCSYDSETSEKPVAQNYWAEHMPLVTIRSFMDISGGERSIAEVISRFGEN